MTTVSTLKVMTEDQEVEDFLASVSSAPFLALDTETSGLDPHTDRVLLLQVGTATQQALVDAQAVSPRVVRAMFRPDRPVVLHNAAFDIKMLWSCYGPELGLEQASILDTLSSERLLRNGRRSDVVLQGWGLKVLAERYAGMELDKTVREGFIGMQSISDMSEAELFYAARDVEATWKVFAEQLPQLQRERLMRVAAIEGAAQVAFAQLEYKGAPIDAEAWREQLDKEAAGASKVRAHLDREFWEVTDRDLFGGSTLNYDSDEEVLIALQKLGLSLKTTRRDVLLATGHPAAKLVSEYREHRKIVSTYGESFLGHIHEKTGRLHPRFKPIGALTGRSSCSEPNLQNIPAGSEFRACFRAPEGRRLITADYAGAELRILAEASRDPVFVRALAMGEDLHSTVAMRLFGKPVSKEIRPELRARAKAINFGLAYGMSARGLGQQLEIGDQEAMELLERYFSAFPRIRGYLDESARESVYKGVAETMAGRRYWFTDMRRDGKNETTLLRVAKNMPIQGTNADITKLAMVRTVAAFAKEGLDAFLVNMVHDELVVEASEADAERAKEVLVREMMSAGAELITVVPMTVEATIGTTWSK